MFDSAPRRRRVVPFFGSRTGQQRGSAYLRSLRLERAELAPYLEAQVSHRQVPDKQLGTCLPLGKERRQSKRLQGGRRVKGAGLLQL